MQNPALRRSTLYGRKHEKFAGKEPDAETGLYYYGARYLDPKTSRWLSGDPAMGEYFPSAPVNDDAKKHNQKLPNGGVYNFINLHTYHYTNNNPVKYTDPDGKIPFMIVTGIIGAVACAGYSIAADVAAGKDINWNRAGLAAGAGALAGLLLGAGTAALVTGSASAASTAVLGGLGLGGTTTAGLTVAKGVETGIKNGQMGWVLIKGNEIVAFSTNVTSHLELAIQAGLDPNSVVGATVLKMRDVIKIVPSSSVQGATQEVLNLLSSIIQ